MKATAAWAPVAAQLSATIGKFIAVDADAVEDLRQALLVGFVKALAPKKKRPANEGGSSSKSAKTVVLEAPTAADEDELRKAQWCRTQPIAVAKFVRRVRPPWEGDSHPRVEWP